jgi:glycerol-3-phosphate dehydrogenase (NAD(P)+)
VNRIGIIGAGAWGTALALIAGRAGREVVIWAREPEVVEAINARRENPLFLPGVMLDPKPRATATLAEAAGCDAVLIAVPAQFFRAVLADAAGAIKRGVPVVSCAKGLSPDGKLMTEVMAELIPDAVPAVLSGPTFASEAARGLPTAATLASTPAGHAVAEALADGRFRPYVSDDLIGAQIGGAVKNVLAIACGIATGRGLGENARAALITRGLAEMTRLALAKGGRAETLSGLSGLGDLVLTAMSEKSRNYSLGVALGHGRLLEDVLAERRSVAEGVFSAAPVAALARTLHVDMPIAGTVDAILNQGHDIGAAISALLARPLRNEGELQPGR